MSFSFRRRHIKPLLTRFSSFVSSNSSWSLFFLFLAIGFVGAVILGFIAGLLLVRFYLLLAVFGLPLLYIGAIDRGYWRAALLFLLLLFTQFAAWTGVNNAPLGAGARMRGQELIVQSKSNPADGKTVSESIDAFITKESNWFMPSSFEYRALEKARDDSLAAYNAHIAELKKQKEIADAEAARQQREQQIADGSYMPSETEVGRTCKELAEENALTRRVDWGFLGLANSKWFPAQKTIILEGRTKNAFGVDIPFSIECRWEKGGVVRVVEVN